MPTPHLAYREPYKIKAPACLNLIIIQSPPHLTPSCPSDLSGKVSSLGRLFLSRLSPTTGLRALWEEELPLSPSLWNSQLLGTHQYLGNERVHWYSLDLGDKGEVSGVSNQIWSLALLLLHPEPQSGDWKLLPVARPFSGCLFIHLPALPFPELCSLFRAPLTSTWTPGDDKLPSPNSSWRLLGSVSIWLCPPI